MTQEKEIIEKQVAEWGNDAPMLYLQPGSTMVRLLPAYSEAGVFFRKIVKHRVRTSGQTFVCACPAEMEGVYCPICAKAQEMKDSGDQVKMKQAKDMLKPQVKYLYNVLCYSAPADRQGNAKEFGVVYVMEAGIMVHRALVSLDTDAMTGWVDITNFETGVNVVVKRTGNALDTKYEVSPTGHGRSNVLADLAARGIDTSKLEPNNLDALYSCPPTEKLEEVVAGLQFNAPMTQQQAFPQMQPVAPATFTAPPVVPAPPVTVVPAAPVVAPVRVVLAATAPVSVVTPPMAAPLIPRPPTA
jgi:hypothetical protein